MSAAAGIKQLKQDELVDEASAIVHRVTGIQLGEKQAAMVQARLSKRMIELRMNSSEYLDYMRANEKKETTVLISLLTTHHTFFFREFAHFEFLAGDALKKLVASVRAQGRKNLRIWSAASSFGQEVYSLSMLLNAHLKQIAPDFTYEILGTDVDPESVAVGRNGVYKWDEIKGIPAAYMGDNWAKGTGEIAAFVKAKKSIKDPCKFDVCNLTELDKDSSPKKFDVVFCRNVLIYFNQQQIQTIARELVRRLEPHGLLFLGISESLMGLDVPVAYGGPSIYVHKDAAPASSSAKTTQTSVSSAPRATPGTTALAATLSAAPAPEKPIRILCVDDSPVILSLLKKIFSSEPGFEVVATAGHGLEAAEALRKHQVDAVTLDIHMPQQTGLEYLQKNFGPNHPPVVMVTSVSREDSQLGISCLDAGARDFVEKPSLNNLEEKGEELRMKVRCAARTGRSGGGASGMVGVAKSFAKPAAILNPERKLRVIVCGVSDRERLIPLLRDIRGSQPATLLLVQGGENVLEGMLPKLSIACGGKVERWDGKSAPVSGFHVADFSKVQEVGKVFANRRTGVLVFGDVTKSISQKLTSWAQGGRAFLILEESTGFSKCHQDLKKTAGDCLPVTSFGYTVDMYLSRDV